MSKNSPSRVLARRFGWRITSALFATVLFWGISQNELRASAIRALETIDFNGSGILVDSFDSADPAHSFNGLYPVGYPERILDGGDVLTTSTFINAIGVANTTIRGRAGTGPNGTVSVGPAGSVSQGIFDNVNTTYLPVSLPSDFSAGGVIYNNLNVNGILYSKAILYSGDYQVTGISGTFYIASNVVCRIRVTGSISVIGTGDQIRIASGARVKLYMSGSSASFKGIGVVNENPNAESFMYFGLPSNTTFSLNKTFIGTVYAPQANVSLTGSSLDPLEFIGCIMAKSFGINSSVKIHFDENLYRVGPFPPAITNHPQSQTVALGESVTFTASGFGPQPYGYQWYYVTNFPSWAPVPGATNGTLTLTHVDVHKAGRYHLVATNSYGFAASADAILTVTTPPFAVPARTNFSTLVGGNVLLSCIPEGNGPFSLRWFLNETNEVASGSSPFLNLTNVQLSAAGSYTIMVTNAFGATTSAPIALTVYETAAASLSGFVPTSESGSQFSISGVPGYKYAIESSTNLADWERVVTNTAPFNFTDTNAVVLPQRFYRAIYLP